MRASVLGVCLSALAPAGCLMEYVLPGDPATVTEQTATTHGADDDADDADGADDMDDTDTNASEDAGATGDAPTTGDPPQPCGDGLLRCGEACVDPGADEANCGGCGDPCKSDEMCIVGECRDVLVLACEGCPCADQCPQGDGVLESTTGDGDDPEQRLCCELDEGGDGPTVLCVIGDPEDVLVCPA